MQNFLNLLSGSLILAAFFLAQMAGIVLVPFGLPGPLVQAAAAVALCLATHGARMQWYWAAGFFAVGVIAEIVDLLAGQIGSKKFGGSKKAAWGALIGGFVGAFGGGLIPVPVMGSVVASFIGTFIGAMIGEMRQQEALEPNLRVGMGAVLGRAAGVAMKLFVSFIILIASVFIVAFS
jgi:uncharacterized protein YqgC (DUF456 family)